MVAYNKPEDAPTELGKLLLKAVPPNKEGRKTFEHLAKLLKVSRIALQKWKVNDRVPAARVKRLVEIGAIGQSGGSSRVSVKDFEKFVYNFPDT
jgi:hypothetical protein